MQSLLIVVTVDELLDVTVQIFQVSVFVGVDFLALERLDEALTTGVGLGRQLQRMATLLIPTSR